MKPTTIFVTYNPENNEEQMLAVRLHSIGAVNGFQMFLPDRYNSTAFLDSSTKLRIDQAEYFILFALTSNLSQAVRQEIEYAFQRFKDKSRVLVIFSTRKNIKKIDSEHFTEIYHNALEDSADDVIERILKVVSEKQRATAGNHVALALENKRLKEEKERQNALIALLGIGLGLAILSNLSKN